MVLFLILVVVGCVGLGFVILVQNPKGGGLSGNIAGFSNQFMGVKQTTDVLEKGTWFFATFIGILCMLSVLFLKDSGTSDRPNYNPNAAPVQQQAPPSNPPQ
ncbi:MAG: secG [Chitinophagaceae bacterium]|jgi:preprotein translocase subunit SecG|nr:secG [Chitinophagaceae bacterium]